MKKETVIETIIEIANEGDSTCGAIDLLKDELKELYSPNEITNIIEVAKMGKKTHDKNRFSKGMCELVSNKSCPISHEDNIKNFFIICCLF